MDADILLALAPLRTAFDRLGVRHHIGGSVASSVYGVPRSTLDVDLVAALLRDQVRPLVEALRGEYYVDEDMILDAVRRHACFNVIHLSTMLKLDVFVLKPRPYDQTAFARMRRQPLAEGEEYFVASPEDTILNKLEWYRMGNEIAERQWKDVIGVLRVQSGALDREYLENWAGVLGIADLLARALDEAGM